MSGDTDRSEFEIEQAVFTLLTAFYNMNPGNELLGAVKRLEAVGQGADELSNYVSLIKNHAEGVVDEASMLELKRDWTKLFRGVSPDYGPIPPYEQLFSGGEIAETVGTLANIYADYSFEVQNERHDYIGVEFAFLAHLAALACKSCSEGEAASFERYSKEFYDFFNNHPKRWFSKFKQAALPCASTDFYKGVLEFTELVLMN
ncbi:MAG: molecular chaperone TorD family protein [Deferribacteraceae bacterium]|jgi:TorA maturation chaperone TorD|nr:molecular chaperone TorD family protein [Deferribacteraceae bacterium]